MNCRENKWTIIVSVLCVTLTIFGTALLIFNKRIIMAVARKQLVLKNGTEAFENWLEPPVPFYEYVYVFNITNSAEFAAGSETLELKEIGPFVYRQTRIKNIDDVCDKEVCPTITLMPQYLYEFQPSMSNGLTEEVNITTVNIPLVSARTTAYKARAAMPLAFNLVKAAMGVSQEPLIITRTVKELVFGGFQPKIFTTIRAMMAGFPEDFKKKIARLIPPPKFAILFDKNMTNKEGVWTIGTGSDNIKNLAQLREWNESPTIEYYNGTQCEKVLGSDGGQFPPDVTEKDKLAVFTGIMCRPVWFTFKSNTKVKSFNTLRFEIKTLDDKHPSGENCFCTKEDNNCFGDGVADISPCNQDAPIAVSKPHFLDAPEKLTNINGLNPLRNEHDTLVDVEPWTGVPLKASVKFQINIETEPEEELYKMTYPKKMVPLLWFETKAEVDEASSNKLKSKLFSKIAFFKAVAGSMVGLGVCIGLVYAVVVYNKRRKGSVKLNSGPL